MAWVFSLETENVLCIRVSLMKTKLVVALVGFLAGLWSAQAAKSPLPVTIEKGDISFRASGVALYRSLYGIPAGQKLTFYGKYDPEADRIYFLDPSWIHVKWPRRQHWRIYFLGRDDSRYISQYLEPAEADILVKLPAIRNYIKNVKDSGNRGRSVHYPELSLHDVYAGKVPKRLAKFDAHKTIVGVFCDNLGNTKAEVQQAFSVKPDKKPARLLPGMIARFTGEILPNRPELSYHQKEAKKIHHFNLKLTATQPIKVVLEAKAARRVCVEEIRKVEKQLREICKKEGLTYKFDPEKDRSLTGFGRNSWVDGRVVFTGLITPYPGFSFKPVPYAVVSVFFDPGTGKPEKIVFGRRMRQDPWD